MLKLARGSLRKEETCKNEKSRWVKKIIAKGPDRGGDLESVQKT